MRERCIVTPSLPGDFFQPNSSGVAALFTFVQLLKHCIASLKPSPSSAVFMHKDCNPCVPLDGCSHQILEPTYSDLHQVLSRSTKNTPDSSQ
ncbi:hypothetical protein CDAR_554611 [Caerostris darwini]|uniref:Uncharacterized protein n=1 Tax=Caerostris darwini TaxID=1538125 RepID=A0AAV4PM38_9ARAC|nr:hypothetical protein CDAR_554611 [Caerostris darwini]